MPSRTRNVLFAVLATLLPILVLAIVWEIALWRLEPPLPENRGSVIRPSGDPDKGYELVPGSEGMVAGAEVSVNRLGCRDRDYPLVRPPGVIRIVGIGDSLTFGQGVAEEDTYLARLERDLEARHLRAEVINCGVYGYNVNEEARRFAELVDLLKPDIVLIGYELGDLLANPPLRQTAANAGSQERPRRFDRGAFFNLLKRSRVISFLAYRYSFLMKNLSLRDWDSLYAPDNPLWINLAEKYALMGARARDAGVDVAVLIIPELSNLDERYPFVSVHERVAAMCREQGMRAVDLLPSFLGKDGPRLWIHPRDRHPNAEGHRIIADAILDPVAAMVNLRASPRPGADSATPR